MIAFPALDIHLAWLGQDVVVLDIVADRYTCLVGAAAVMQQLDDGAIDILGTRAAQDLEAAGLINSQRPPSRKAFTPPCEQIDPGSASLIAGLSALVRAHRWSGDYHGRSLRQIVAATTAEGDAPAAPPKTDRRAALSAHSAAMPWLPRQEACLHRAFLLRRHLLAADHTSDWVFGVRTWPFLAHCWIQIGDVVIGDVLERVRRYTPILVL